MGGVRCRFQQEEKNAIKMLLDLANHNDGTPVRLKDIASRQNISVKYLEQIVMLLLKGIAASERERKSGRLSSEISSRTVHHVSDSDCYRGESFASRMCRELCESM